MLLNSGLLYGLAFVAEKLYAVSHADMGGIYVVTAGFPDSAFEKLKVARSGNEYSKVHDVRRQPDVC